MSDFHSLTVTDVTREGRDGVCLSLAVPGGLREAFAFTPGQYVTLRTEIAGEDIRRPYSICSVPGTATLQVGVKRVAGGRMSNHLNDLPPGKQIDVMPPEGRFQGPPRQGARYLLIAAGSGITPMLSIAEAALAAHDDAEVTLVYGNRETGTIMFLDRLSDLKDRHLGRLTTVHVLSRERMDAPLFHGRIDGDRLAALEEAGLIDPLGATGVFLCGPGGMIDTAQAHFATLGIPNNLLHSERFLPADGQIPTPPSQAVRTVAAEGVEVETILDGLSRTFTLTDPSEAVLTAAGRAGIDLPFSCAGGMCCTCRCRIAEGSAEMAVNYSLEPWEIEKGFTLACQARPTSKRLVLDFDAV